MSDEPDLKAITLHQAITETKLHGSCLMLQGHTEPEGWPFVVLVAVAKPGNERIVALARAFAAEAERLAKDTTKRDWRPWP